VNIGEFACLMSVALRALRLEPSEFSVSATRSTYSTKQHVYFVRRGRRGTLFAEVTIDWRDHMRDADQGVVLLSRFEHDVLPKLLYSPRPRFRIGTRAPRRNQFDRRDL
jgi:hypothetical protein